MGAGAFYTISLFDLLIGKKNIILHFEMKLFVLTEAVSNRETCIFKAVLLLCEHAPPPPQ